MPGCCDGATGVAVLRVVCGGMASVPGVACRGPDGQQQSTLRRCWTRRARERRVGGGGERCRGPRGVQQPAFRVGGGAGGRG